MNPELVSNFINCLEEFGHVRISGLVDTRMNFGGPKDQVLDIYFDGSSLCIGLTKNYVLEGYSGFITIEDNDYKVITKLLAFLIVESLNKKLDFPLKVTSVLNEHYIRPTDKEKLKELVNYLKKTLNTMIKLVISDLKKLKKLDDNAILLFLIQNRTFYEDLLLEDVRSVYNDTNENKKDMEELASKFNYHYPLRKKSDIRDTTNPYSRWQACLDILLEDFSCSYTDETSFTK